MGIVKELQEHYRASDSPIEVDNEDPVIHQPPPLEESPTSRPVSMSIPSVEARTSQASSEESREREQSRSQDLAYSFRRPSRPPSRSSRPASPSQRHFSVGRRHRPSVSSTRMIGPSLIAISEVSVSACFKLDIKVGHRKMTKITQLVHPLQKKRKKDWNPCALCSTFYARKKVLRMLPEVRRLYQPKSDQRKEETERGFLPIKLKKRKRI